jgi:hypothetical protein
LGVTKQPAKPSPNVPSWQATDINVGDLIARQEGQTVVLSERNQSTTPTNNVQKTIPVDQAQLLQASQGPNKYKKVCNCTKSQCLKLYCDCFASGEFCDGCNCVNCFNNIEHEETRQAAVSTILERNPTAFRPKIGPVSGAVEGKRHNRGCNCKRSYCLKNYCECFEVEQRYTFRDFFHQFCDVKAMILGQKS